MEPINLGLLQLFKFIRKIFPVLYHGLLVSKCAGKTMRRHRYRSKITLLLCGEIHVSPMKRNLLEDESRSFGKVHIRTLVISSCLKVITVVAKSASDCEIMSESFLPVPKIVSCSRVEFFYRQRAFGPVA